MIADTLQSSHFGLLQQVTGNVANPLAGRNGIGQFMDDKREAGRGFPLQGGQQSGFSCPAPALHPDCRKLALATRTLSRSGCNSNIRANLCFILSRP